MNQTVRFSGGAVADTLPAPRDASIPDTLRRAAPASERGLSITVRGLRKAFGGNEVLRGVDLHIPAGQFVAIVGRSGCGKSTLLRLIAELDAPSGGHLAFADGADSHRGQLRVMFQEPRLLPWASVRGNVEVGLVRERNKANAASRADDTLREVGLSDKAGEWPSRLSGGQRQRVALARALVSRPRALLLDEPLGALDALTRITMQQLVERVWQEQGFTAILVTHDVQEAVALADRILVIEDGKISRDIDVTLARPRIRGSAAFGEIEGSILDQLMGSDAA